MYFLIYFSIIYLLPIHAEDQKDPDVPDISVNDIADNLILLLGINGNNESARIKELRDKLDKIDSYVIDKEKYAELLISKTKHTHLNQTNFYESLNDNDHFKFNNDTKNLYLKLKEKMNRDDVMKILSEKAESKMKKSARKMLDGDIIESKQSDWTLNDAVNKYIGEKAIDNHNFSKKLEYSKYWDPQIELEEKQARLEPSRRLYRGERTSIRYYPFMVSVHIMGRFWCGGAIYWHDLIITSASCLQLMHNNRFFRENPKALAVRIGSNHSRVGGEMVDALEVYFHPAYNPRTLYNNIAMIRLRRRLRFSYHRIPKQIEISTEDGGMAYTAEVLLLGWGVTKTSQTMAFEPIFLQRKMLPVYPKKFCEEVYGKKFLTDSMFCAGTLTTGEGACDHDAGGPAVLNGKLVGIISFGPAVCGFPDAPTVFTYIGSYIDWIETVNETMPDYYRGHKRTTTSTPDPFVHYFHTATVQALATTTALPEHLATLLSSLDKAAQNEAKGPDLSLFRAHQKEIRKKKKSKSGKKKNKSKKAIKKKEKKIEKSEEDSDVDKKESDEDSFIVTPRF